MNISNTAKNTVIGIIAHVDAGKTTLSEAILYKSNVIRSAGRVDNGTSYMDTDEMEKRRGITIFSNEARFTRGTGETERTFILLDTPGHTDFSPEMERALNVLDYVILIISAPDGFTGQARLLMKLINHYHIPCFIFVNKMDQPGMDRTACLENIRAEAGSKCIDLSEGIESDEIREELAVCDDALLSSFLEGRRITEDDVRNMILELKVIPVYFGSALKLEGIDRLLDGIDKWTVCKTYGNDFGCRVYKITHDQNGQRLTHVKLTGGTLKARTVVPGLETPDGKPEKVDQLRLYSSEKYVSVQEVFPGDIVAVTGLISAGAGQGLGFEKDNEEKLLQPVMTSRIILPEKEDPFNTYRKLSSLAEEEPSLNIVYEEGSGELTARLMGTVQKEILRELILKRFGIKVDFSPAKVIYKETITNKVEGVGHFEPLRHYAEVHLILEPGERGSGIVTASDCPTDILALNWQRLIMTHLKEKRHLGVLTGSEITDIRITLSTGRAHEKHTEGGDFRQATYRAVRQGLMMAESLLLEPYLNFSMDIPSGDLGRVLNDLERTGARFSQPEMETDTAYINGSAPAIALNDYPEKLAGLTQGRGHITMSFKGYEPCHDPEEVIAARGYDPEQDIENPSSSVFCYHGSGTIIPWYEVRGHMQVESVTYYEMKEKEEIAPRRNAVSSNVSEADLMAIFERTYGPIKDRNYNKTEAKTVSHGPVKQKLHKGKPRPEKEYLLVDGYNIIYSWDDLKDLSGADLKAARDSLMDILSNYAGFSSKHVILVFDAYKVPGGTGHSLRYHNIDVVYTEQAQTADLYIEQTARELSKNYGVSVATSDAVEQVIIYGAGAHRLSARDLLSEIIDAEKAIKEEYLDKKQTEKNYLKQAIPKELL